MWRFFAAKNRLRLGMTLAGMAALVVSAATPAVANLAARAGSGFED